MGAVVDLFVLMLSSGRELRSRISSDLHAALVLSVIPKQI
jgi:hypothetical protein